MNLIFKNWMIFSTITSKNSCCHHDKTNNMPSLKTCCHHDKTKNTKTWTIFSIMPSEKLRPAWNLPLLHTSAWDHAQQFSWNHRHPTLNWKSCKFACLSSTKSWTDHIRPILLCWLRYNAFCRTLLYWFRLRSLHWFSSCWKYSFALKRLHCIDFTSLRWSYFVAFNWLGEQTVCHHTQAALNNLRACVLRVIFTAFLCPHPGRQCPSACFEYLHCNIMISSYANAHTIVLFQSLRNSPLPFLSDGNLEHQTVIRSVFMLHLSRSVTVSS